MLDMILPNDFYDVSIFVSTKENEVISYDELDNEPNADYVFIMITNGYLNREYEDDNTIYISTDVMNQMQLPNVGDDVWLMKNEYTNTCFNKKGKNGIDTPVLIWQADSQQLDETKEYLSDLEIYMDLNGYEKTNRLISNAPMMLRRHNQDDSYWKCYRRLKSIHQYIPAAMAAYETKVKFQNQIYNGYIPSIGQVLLICHEWNRIDEIITLSLNRNGYKLHQNDILWSSSRVYNKGYSYVEPILCIKEDTKIMSTIAYDTTRCSVLPLFKLT